MANPFEGLEPDTTGHLARQQLEERTRELATLLEISRGVASTLELRPLLSVILEQMSLVADYTGASILIPQEETLRTLARASRDETGRLLFATVDPASDTTQEGTTLGYSFPLQQSGPIWAQIDRGEAVIIDDAWADTPLARAYREAVGDLSETMLRYVRSWLAVPLVFKGRFTGIISLGIGAPGYYTAGHARLLFGIANQVAAAIENARLYEAARESARRAAALATIAAHVALGGSLQTVLDRLAQSVVEATGTEACAVMLGSSEGPSERIAGSFGIPEGFAAAKERALRNGARPLEPAILGGGRPVVHLHAREQLLAQPEWGPLHPFLGSVTWGAAVYVPLIAHEQNLGSLVIDYRAGEEPDDAELAFLGAIADQAAVAVENARLFAEAQDKAAFDERRRLARELHDSVSQALYGITLGARTARTLLDRQPRPNAAQLVQPLDYVLSLAETGLAEMRALIFELRPESLATDGLAAALDRQAILVRVRHGLGVETELAGEPALPLESKEALYRIGQEALHNSVKHAEATRIRLRLFEEAERIVLEVADDGAGFDPEQTFPGHWGLQSMRERAERAGGSLSIESRPGRGTRVRVSLPAVPESARGETQAPELQRN